MTVSDLQKPYRGQMTPSERKAAYQAGENVGHIPVSRSVRKAMAPLYGYSMRAFRDSIEVKHAVHGAMRADFGCEGLTAGLGLTKIGEALGRICHSPESGFEALVTGPFTAAGQIVGAWVVILTMAVARLGAFHRKAHWIG